MGVMSGLGTLMDVFGPLWAGEVYDHDMTGSVYWMGTFILTFAGWMLIQRHVVNKNFQNLLLSIHLT
jgi:hypothetical protein